MKNVRDKQDTFLNSVQNKPIVNINSNVDSTILALPNIENVDTSKMISYPDSSLTLDKQLTFNENNLVTAPTSKLNICDKLRSWVIQYNPSHNSANCILNIMQSEGLNVPKDIRTLMRTPKTHEITNLGDGSSYIHFGIKNMILPILIKYNRYLNTPNNILKIGLNIDGLPLSKSSKSQLWPILISILNLKQFPNTVIAVGVFHGTKKPNFIEEFLNPFIIDLLDVFDTGIIINDNVLKLEISNIVCDAPAKSFLLNVKNFNAYSGCTSCTVEGEYIENRMAFLSLDSPLRTDDSFRKKIDEDYHKGNSPLESLPINIIDTVCLDYMHCVLLGVVKRLVQFWIKGKKDIRLIEEIKKKINEDIYNLRSYTPSEFCRLPRPLDDIEYWKASELRLFLLYSGPIILKGRLKKKLYNHFLHLSFAIRILICPETCTIYNNEALKLLRTFVKDYSIIYGKHFLTYNVHSLLHLPNYVLIHGSLDNFSSFRYENYLQEIKKIVKCSKYPLAEISNRILEKQKVVTSREYIVPKYPIMVKEIENKVSSPHIPLSAKLYKKIIIDPFKLIVNSTKENDRYVLLKNNSIIIVHKIVSLPNENAYIIAKRFLNVTEFTNKPSSSIITGVYCVHINELSDQFCVNISDIKYKCYFVKVSSTLAIISMLCHGI